MSLMQMAVGRWVELESGVVLGEGMGDWVLDGDILCGLFRPKPKYGPFLL